MKQLLYDLAHFTLLVFILGCFYRWAQCDPVLGFVGAILFMQVRISNRMKSWLDSCGNEIINFTKEVIEANIQDKTK
jgi:hypothetical protein